MNRYVIIALSVVAFIVVVVFVLSRRDIPEQITYGASFSKLHAEELGLNWADAYRAMLNDLQVKHLRLTAHWPMIEPNRGEYNFDEIDYQMTEARKAGADVILAVGLRTPNWPECHHPAWSLNMNKEEKEKALLEYIELVVNKYKNAPNLKYWQVENEAFLKFATQYCDKADEELLKREIDLVKSLDPNHPILMTDSGEFGKWYKPWQHGDVFGTSQYLYVWYNPFGAVRYPIGPWFFKLKRNVMEFLYGEKKALLIELGAEPWLDKPIKDASDEEQFARMSIAKFKEVVAFGTRTSFDEQYLWGVEWWYYQKQKGNSEFWDYAKEIFSTK